MRNEREERNLLYQKAVAEIIYFDDDDVITTSGNTGGGCLTWSNQNGVSCHFGLTN